TKGPDEPRPVQPEAGSDRLRPRDDQAVVQDQSVTALPDEAQPTAAIESGSPAPGHGQPPAQPGPADPPQPVNPPAEATAMPGGSPAEGAKAAQERVDWSDIVDPDGDCKVYQDQASDRVTIGVPGTPHVLSAEFSRMNAPRLLRAVRGDFEV